MTHRIAFIGFGTIGKDVANGLRAYTTHQMAALCRRADARLDADVFRLDTMHDLLRWQPDIVVEVAGQQAVHEYAARTLRAGIPFLVSSVGALADDVYLAHLKAVASAHNTRVVIPSGAVASLDYLRAVSADPETKVVYESRKPAAAWTAELQAADYHPSDLTQEVVLYEGPADAAAQQYPKNLNVAATLALAGVGMRRTHVQVVVDPAACHNQHVLHVTGPVGSLEMRLTNLPAAANPKTSAVVAHSVRAAIMHYFDPLQFA